MVWGQGCWKQIAVSKNGTDPFTIGLTNDGKLFGWGVNNYGQLGIGNTINQINPIQIGTSTDWKEIATTGSSTVAIKNNGTLWAWGEGALMGNNNSNTNIPTQIGTASDWKTISTGDFHVFAIKNNGTLWATGRGSYGQLGNGSTNLSTIFIQIGTDNNWKQVSGGNVFSVGLKTDGTLWTWGSDSIGQLGNGNSLTSNVLIPTQIGTDTNWDTVSAGKDNVLARKTDGTLWSWGSNNSGKLGIGNTTYKTSPVQVGSLNTWLKIATGNDHCGAIKNDGTLWIWGRNYDGALGCGYDSNTVSQITSPYNIGNLTDWKDIFFGGFNSSSIKNNGTIFVWGSNFYNQIGFSLSNTEQIIPISLACPTTLNTIVNDYLEKIILYPNPTSTLLNVDNSFIVEQYQIFDISGKIVLNGNSNTIDVSMLKKGMYFIKLNNNQTVKFIKE